MVNNTKNSQDNKNNRLSMRNSFMVWIAGAVLGWVVAVVSVWTAMSTTDGNMASNAPTTAEEMEQIMPAAGEKDPQNNMP